jgi:hypothetical protein
MNAEQQAHHKRDKAVVAVLDKYQSVWAGNAGLTAARTALDNGNKLVDDLEKKQGTVTTGVTQDKATARRAAAAAAALVAGALAAYADKTGNHELFAQADFTIWDLTHGKEEEDQATAANLLQLGTDNLAALTTEGTLSQAELDDLEQKLGVWTGRLAKPREAKAGTKSATDQLPAALLANDRTINRQITPLMEKYRLPSPDFFHEIEVAKIIVDPSYRHEPPPAPPTPR